MLAETIREIHDASRQTYGARRVHPDLVLGRGVVVARCTVEIVMRRHGLAGLPGRPRFRKMPNQSTATDLVERQFHRDEQHPTMTWTGSNGRAIDMLSEASVEPLERAVLLVGGGRADCVGGVGVASTEGPVKAFGCVACRLAFELAVQFGPQNDDDGGE